MASAAQISANRLNAQLSTGPRTLEGKAKSARNRTGHGLFSREFVIRPSQEAAFEEFLAGLHQDIKPHGALENDLFTQFAHAAWNLRRCRIAERELQDSCTHGADPILDAEVADRLRLIDLNMPTFPPAGLDVSSILAAKPAPVAQPDSRSEHSNPIPGAARTAAR